MINQFVLGYYMMGVTSGRMDVNMIPNPYRDEIKRQLGIVE